MTNVKNFALNSTEEMEKQIKSFSESDAYNGCKIRIMPDGHSGIGAVVGSTIEYKDKIVPATVGVDIACRVSAFKIPNLTSEELKKLHEIITKKVPAGFSIHKKRTDFMYKNDINYESLYSWEHLKNKERIALSLGTLGSGNHYIEVDISPKGDSYLIIHCGSRNLGKQVCDYYQNEAIKYLSNSIYDSYSLAIKELVRENDFSNIEKYKKIYHKEKNFTKSLAYLEDGLMEQYLSDMRFCNIWTELNHKAIYSAIANEMEWKEDSFITCCHNYVDVENGIIRKGAISGYKGELGLIPLNMRDGILLVSGKGNEDWNYSLPHGAGRLMSRTEAKNKIALTDYEESMNGIYAPNVEIRTIDEAPMAYKNAKDIVNAIKENADVIDWMKPVYNFKAV